MGVFFRNPVTESGETLVWQVRCNRWQGVRAVGGQLALTDRALIFEPNRIDRLFRGESWRAELRSISSVREQPPLEGGAPQWMASAGRSRLRVEMRDGSIELLGVPKLGARLHDLERRVGDETK
jgi:hypothetical protein